MPEPLTEALTEVRTALLDPDRLVRAVGAGHRRGSTPQWTRVELRPVALKSGRFLQLVADDGTRPTTSNHVYGAPAADTVDALLAEPFGNWHVETVERTLQLRVTKRGEAQVHRAAAAGVVADVAHDRAPAHLLAPDDRLFSVVGGNAAKRRQVDAFLRALAATLGDDATGPLRVVDLGCGNAYLTFAAYRYLAERGLDPELVGVDVREDQRVRNSALAAELGWSDRVSFVAGTIAGCDVPAPDVVLALHACDTATDEALARAVGWRARYVLAAPCCHHDLSVQLRRLPAPPGYAGLTGQAILRERFADVLTDTLRAALLRRYGYSVDVVEFIDSVHTPRNLLLRGRLVGGRDGAATPDDDEYSALVAQWGVTPRLRILLDAVPATVAGAPNG